MEIDNKSEIDTIWQLLPTDPIAAYAKSGHPFAQYYYLRRNIDNVDFPKAEKVQMMRNVMTHNVIPNLMNYFTLSEFYNLQDALIMENLFALPSFEEKLSICTDPEIFCRIFFLYCIYLQRNKHYLEDNSIITTFANSLEKIARPQTFEEIVDVIEQACPQIPPYDLGRIYRIIYGENSPTELTLRYLSITPGVADKLKVGSINDLTQTNISDAAEIIPKIWLRCINESYIKNYDCLVALAMLNYSQDRTHAVELIHQDYPQLLYGPLQEYRSESPELSLVLLTNPTHLRHLSPNVLIGMLNVPLLANLPANRVRAILLAIIKATLPQDLHCELLFQMLNHIIIPYEDEIFSVALCDIKLLLKIQIQYQSRRRYFAFLSNHKALAKQILSTIEKNSVLIRLCRNIPTFNEVIIEFAINPKSNQRKIVFDESNHQPRFLAPEMHKPKKTALSLSFTEIMPDLVVVPDSPVYREIAPRNFPEHFRTPNTFDPNECLASIQRLFLGNALSFFKSINGHLTRIAVENVHHSTEPLHLIRGLLAAAMKQPFTWEQLQEFCLTKLIELLPVSDIDKLLDGQQSTLANQALFALVEILKLPYPLVSYYFNARYEFLQHLSLYHDNEAIDIFNF